jgi:hypothetical protein
MYEHLIEREREENFRTSTRSLEFPDGETRTIEAYRLIWTWYDRIIAHPIGPDEDEILTLALETQAWDGCIFDVAIGRVVETILKDFENWPEGFDFTDDLLKSNLAKRHMAAFRERKDS